MAVRLVLIAISLCVHPNPADHPAEKSDMRQYMQGGEYFARGMWPPGALLPQRDRLLPMVLGGVFVFTGRSIPAAQITDMILATSGLFALFPLARMFVSERLAVLACGLWVFDPQFVGQSCLPLSENLATPLYILAMFCLVRGRERQSPRWALLAAVVLAIALWARASTVLLAAGVMLWLCGWPGSAWKRASLIALTFAFVGASWLGASVLSYRLFGFFAPNTHTYILWDNAANKLLVQTGQARDLREAHLMRLEQIRRDLGPDASLRDRLTAAKASAIDLVKKHPLLQLRNHTQAFIATAFMPDRWSMTSLLGIGSEGGTWHSTAGLKAKLRMVVVRWGWPTILYATGNFVFTMILWWWAARSTPQWFKSRHRGVLLLLGLALITTLAAGVINIEGMPRYRLPAMPMLVLLAVAGLGRGRRHPPRGEHGGTRTTP